MNYDLTVGSYSRLGRVNYITVSRHSMAHHGRKHGVAPDGGKEVKDLHGENNNRLYGSLEIS